MTWKEAMGKLFFAGRVANDFLTEDEQVARNEYLQEVDRLTAQVGVQAFTPEMDDEITERAEQSHPEGFQATMKYADIVEGLRFAGKG